MKTFAYGGLLATLVVTAGCAGLGRTIEHRVAIGQACQSILSAEFQPTTVLDLRSQALARLGFFWDPEKLDGESRFLAIRELQGILRRNGLRWGKPVDPSVPVPQPPQPNVVDVSPLEDAFVKAEEQIESTDGLSLASGEDWLWNCSREPARAARCIQKSEAELSTLITQLGAVQAAALDVAMDAAIKAKKAGRQAESELEVWTANLRGSMRSLEGALTDSGQILADWSRTSGTYFAAESMVHLIHLAIIPIDRQLEKVDAQAYGLVSLSYFSVKGDVERSVGSGVNGMIDNVVAGRSAFSESAAGPTIVMGGRPGSMSATPRTIGNTGMKLAEPLKSHWLLGMARGSCRRLNDNKNVTLAADMVDSAIVTRTMPDVILESRRQQTERPPRCAAPQAATGLSDLGLAVSATEKQVFGEDVSTKSHCSATPSVDIPAPLQAYMVQEWASRKALIEREQGRRAEATARSGKSEKNAAESALPMPDERLVQEVAEMAIAPVIGTEWLQRAHQRDFDHWFQFSPRFSSSDADTRAEATQAVYLDINRQSQEINNAPVFAPVFNIDREPPRSFCDEPGLAGRVSCRRVDDSYEVKPITPFGSGQASNSAVAAELMSVVDAARTYRARSGIPLEAIVRGLTSLKEAKPWCNVKDFGSAAGASDKIGTDVKRPGSVAYQTTLNTNAYLDISNCKPPNGDDGNLTLGSGRAAFAAKIIEAGDWISVKDVRSDGPKYALATDKTDDRAQDRTVIVRLEPITTMGKRSDPAP